MVEHIHINPHTMLKKDMLVYLSGRCKHGHKYVEHPACYIKEQGKEVKVGFLDIETTGFPADFNFILTYCIKTMGKDEYNEGMVTKEEIQSFDFDKRLVKDLMADILKYDVIITYYGTRFDIPFIRSRALNWGYGFLEFNLVKHKDVYYMVKRLLKLTRNTLEKACKLCNIPGKNHVEGDIWIKAGHGDKEALEYVMKHNRPDVIILEKLYKKLCKYDKGLLKSI